jgi:adenylylsulfate kinase-like enzyme
MLQNTLVLLFSCVQKMADALSAERLAFTSNHISAVYVTGIAGSGKSSSVGWV